MGKNKVCIHDTIEAKDIRPKDIRPKDILLGKRIDIEHQWVEMVTKITKEKEHGMYIYYITSSNWYYLKDLDEMHRSDTAAYPNEEFNYYLIKRNATKRDWERIRFIHKLL